LSDAKRQVKRATEAKMLKLPIMSTNAIMIVIAVAAALDPVLGCCVSRLFVSYQVSHLRRVEDVGDRENGVVDCFLIPNAKHQTDAKTDHQDRIERRPQYHGSGYLLAWLFGLLGCKLRQY
jgi:hypothetical protein